jgi:hypothetical protein
MKRFSWLVLIALVISLSVMFSGAAQAQGYPQVAQLTPFSVEAQFMSLPGYLRWQVFLEQGQWISVAEAKAVVMEQQKGQ